MSFSIILANPKETWKDPQESFLRVSEFFCDSIQGEGVNTGCPAAFLRVQNCSLNCVWCDTRSVWRYGNPYTFDELFRLMENADLPRKFKQGQHLVLTGGSPLLQQDSLIVFLDSFVATYGFLPYIEVENECVIIPSSALVKLVDCWNNSPKTDNSGNALSVRYDEKVIRYMSSLTNSWFKFVVRDEFDWDDIDKDYLQIGLIKRQQIVLMPMAGSRAELEANREKVVAIAIKNNVRYTTREHIELWDKVVGV